MSLRPPIRAFVLLAAVSAAFPVVAGLIANPSVPQWIGIADVTVAILFVCAAIWLAAGYRDRVSDMDRLTAFRCTLMLLSLIPVLLVVFFVMGDRVNWVVLVIGLAWRSWLLVYTLPYLIAARREQLISKASVRSGSDVKPGDHAMGDSRGGRFPRTGPSLFC